MLNVGKMNKRIWIMEYKEIKDSIGQDTQELAQTKRLWATVKPIKGGEYYTALKLSPEITYVIYVRYRKGINENSIIMYQKKLLEVKYAIDIEEKHELIEIQCADYGKRKENVNNDGS